MVKYHNCDYCTTITTNSKFCSYSCAAKGRVELWKLYDLENYRIRQSNAGKVGGVTASEVHRKNGTNFFNKEYEYQQALKAGLKAKTDKLGYCNPDVQKKANEIQRIKKTGFFNSELQRQLGKKGGLKTIQILRKNSKYLWDGVKFMSNMEVQCAKKILKRPIDGINCNIIIGTKTIDFYPQSYDKKFQGKLAEFHPWDKDGRTFEQYYSDRRKILDENGYKDVELIVIKSLTDIKNEN